MPTRAPLRRDPLPRLHAERRQQLRGLLYLALAAILFLFLRFGPYRIFTPGWWRS